MRSPVCRLFEYASKQLYTNIWAADHALEAYMTPEPFAGFAWGSALRIFSLQVVKGLRGGVQDVALKMLIGETHYQVNSFRQVYKIPGLLHA